MANVDIRVFGLPRWGLERRIFGPGLIMAIPMTGLDLPHPSLIMRDEEFPIRTQSAILLAKVGANGMPVCISHPPDVYIVVKLVILRRDELKVCIIIQHIVLNEKCIWGGKEVKAREDLPMESENGWLQTKDDICVTKVADGTEGRNDEGRATRKSIEDGEKMTPTPLFYFFTVTVGGIVEEAKITTSIYHIPSPSSFAPLDLYLPSLV